MLRKTFLCFLVIFLLQASSQGVVSEKEKLKDIQRKLEIKRQKLKEAKKKEQNSLKKLYLIKRELTTTQRSLYNTSKNLSSTEQKITKLSKELTERKLELLYKIKMLKKRIVETYKNGKVNYWDLLISAANMSDFINRSYFFSKLIDNDVKLVNEITDIYNSAIENKRNLIDKKNEMQRLVRSIYTEKNKISERQKDEKKLYAQLKYRRKEYEKQILELEKSSRELERVILSKTKKKTKFRGSGSFDWPIRGRITSRFGYRRHPLWGGRHLHTGIDIAAPYGDPIRSSDTGEVIFTGWWDGYGKAVVIDHGRNLSTVYAHLSRIYVKVGERIGKGQILGLIGSTGYSTGPHLHFEVRKKGKPVNPIKYLP